MNAYIQRVLDETRAKNANEPEFLQTVEEVLTSLEPVINAHPEYEAACLLERMVEPERTIEFRVAWMDDQRQVSRQPRLPRSVQRGAWPLQGRPPLCIPTSTSPSSSSSASSRPSKTALTCLPIGGAKGGSDFDPIGRSRRRSHALLPGLHDRASIATSVRTSTCPAGDVGVGGREVGYLYGQYRRIVGAAEFGAMSGKAVCTGGSILRPEATGFGAVYYLREVLKHDGKGIKGLRVAMSGYGNVGWGIMKKIDELGGKVTYFAGPDGYIHDPDGVCGEEKLNFILEMRAKDPMHCKPYADKFGVEFVEGQKCWGVKDVDVYMPAATQNDVNMEWAKKIAESGVPYYIEVGNMPTTNDALAFLMSQKHLTVAPSKAVNACGVSVSELEMAQNAQRIYWTAEEVDAKMEAIMKNIYDASVEAAERYGLGYNLVAGANIAGFQKVADAMMAQGIF